MPLVPSPRVWSRFDKKLLSRVSKLLRESGHTIVQDDDFDSIALGMREGERDSIGSVSLSMSVLATVLAGAAFAIAAFDFFLKFVYTGFHYNFRHSCNTRNRRYLGYVLQIRTES